MTDEVTQGQADSEVVGWVTTITSKQSRFKGSTGETGYVLY